MGGMVFPIYLDDNATAPIFPEVADTVREALLRYRGNPSSQHALGREARRALDDGRDEVLQLLGARPGRDRVVFTSGGTEANNLALFGLAPSSDGERADNPRPPGMVISAAEHASVERASRVQQSHGWRVERAPLLPDGTISGSALEAMAEDSLDLVSLAHAHGETGVIQPLADLCRRIRARTRVVHTDAVQTVGKIPVHFGDLGVDALTCAAHKFRGPLGIGMLLLREGVPLEPQIWGGHQQSGMRAGTEPVALVLGLRDALALSLRHLAADSLRVAALRDRFEHRLLGEIPDAVAVGSDAPRLPNTSNVAFPGCDRQALVMALDLEGVACSTGSACASGSSEPSSAHVAMGLPEAIWKGAVRFSFGTGHTPDDADAAVARILLVHRRLRRS